jgi:hypothetical protein
MAEVNWAVPGVAPVSVYPMMFSDGAGEFELVFLEK